MSKFRKNKIVTFHERRKSMQEIKSGQTPFTFAYREGLHKLPRKALTVEENLHGGFAVDRLSGFGHIYYGMPGCGLLRISPDLNSQDLIDLPPNLKNVNFHSTKIGEFDGDIRLYLAANDDSKVIILNLDGAVDYILAKPEFEQYQMEKYSFKPTDAVLVEQSLFVADGYGANYITTADVQSRRWTGIFGGKTDSPDHHNGFGNAHGMNPVPVNGHLAIADRPHSRFEIYTLEGRFTESHPLPAGAWPCGIDYYNWNDHWYAAVACLHDPDKKKPAPIYILNAETYEVVSTVRPKDELNIDQADHIHNAVWHEYNGRLFLICQSWRPGFFFILELSE